jgi:Fe-S cluster assembly iron-binding protein IscA
MIGVTERAKEELKELLNTNTDNPAARLRLSANDEGKLGLGIDIEKPDDDVLEYQGSALLVMESGLSDKLKDVALDVVDSDAGRQLVVINNQKEE